MGRLRWIAPASLFLATSISLAQNANTSLRGVVQDQTGAVIPGATVTLLNGSSGRSLQVKANQQGEYHLPQLEPAKYLITAEAPGFAAMKKQAELLVNQPATVNFTLGAASNGTVIEVNDSAQTLNKSDATIGNAFDNATIQNLPSETRNVPDLLSLQPGVFYVQPPQDVSTADSRLGAVNGERSDQSNVTLDGVDDNDQLRGLAFYGVLRETQDSVQEFRVVTSNANADEGRSSGAQVSLVTKSGTNKYHGAAYEYFRPSNTVSNNYFNKQGQLESGLPNRPPKLIRNIFGADTGGFIVKDRLFFFGNYEGQRLAEDQVVVQTSPTAAYQKGILQYTANGAPIMLTPGQVATLDAGCVSGGSCRTASYPYGPGPNPNALAYFNVMPAANGTTLGDGLNEGSYTFASPAPQTLNTSIARIDWTPGAKHRVFARGNLQKDTLAGTQQFPGQPPSSLLVDNSKGMTFGDTWTITPKLVNDVRYAYIRQGYGSSGVGSGDYVDFRFLSTATAENRSSVFSVPVNNIVDNLTLSEGHHTIGIGGNWRLLHINRSSNQTSFNSASSNPYWLATNDLPDPGTLSGMPTYDSGFANSWLIAYGNLIGTVPQVTNQYNYKVTSETGGTLLADGTPITRHFKSNEYEYYLQDQWQARPNLTITFGIRHTILQTPYETTGQQVAPTIDTHTWYTERESAALAGQISEPDLYFAPSGPYYGRPGFWPKSKNNVAPRFSLAYSPGSKTSIRAGAGIYYSHYGDALINTFDQNGAFGLSSNVTNPANTYSFETSPRFTDRHTLPFSNGTGAPTQTFPYPAPLNNFAISWGLDSRMKTPYSEAFDLSVQQMIPGGFTLEVAYVGRMGRHLLQSLDLAEPVDYTDPNGGGDYYSAGAQLSALVDANGGNAGATVAAIPYFEHVFPYMANLVTHNSDGSIAYNGGGLSATQNIYSLEWAPNRYNLGATTALADIDFPGYCAGLGYCPANHQARFWQDQFSSLYALSTIGMSYYNAAEVTLSHATAHGMQVNVNYTFSKSIDMGSDAERATQESSGGISIAASSIINTWKPYLNRAVSDFDTRHIVTANGIAQLPFGRGRAVMSHANRFVDAFIGGWQYSGIFRVTSGLPFDVFEPGWTTDWNQEGFGVNVGGIKAHKHFDAAGNPIYFASPGTINNGVTSGFPIRLPYPGESGQRNNFRGDGYIDLDSTLSKSWKLERYGAVKFDWSVYNVTNTNRFDPSPLVSLNSQLLSNTLGTASALLGGNQAPRRMQFALRYDF